MNQNPPLTPEEAKKLTFPCLLEVWDVNNRTGYCAIIDQITVKGRFETNLGAYWPNAALPSPEIAEAMSKQFATKSEFPKRMLVWDGDEANAVPKIVIADLGENAEGRYMVVMGNFETEFENGEIFNWTFYRNAKPLPEPDPISQEIAQLEKRIAELKSQQQSK